MPRPVYWRLLSCNNRQLGRSPAAFRCAADAVAAAERVGKARYELEPRLVRLVDPVRWLWTIALDGLPAAVSGRSYERERVAAHALEQFLGGVSDALGSWAPAVVLSPSPIAAAWQSHSRPGRGRWLRCQGPDRLSSRSRSRRLPHGPAGVAQLVAHPTCNRAVRSSSLLVGSADARRATRTVELLNGEEELWASSSGCSRSAGGCS